MKFATDSAAASPDRRGRKYAGLDTLDRRGLSAETGTRCFSEWISTVPAGTPVVVMSHMPLHALRKDNLGARTWLKALNDAGRKHDIIFLWAHNHTMEERAERKGLYKLFGKPSEPLMTLTVGEPLLPDRTRPRKEQVDTMRLKLHAQMERMAGIQNNPWPVIPGSE